MKTYSKYYKDHSGMPDPKTYPRRSDGFLTEEGYSLFKQDTDNKLDEIDEIASQRRNPNLEP